MDETRLREIARAFFNDRHKTIASDDQDLFQAEVIDSLELMELLVHLDEQHGISIDQNEMSADNFRSINAIVATAARGTCR